MKKNELAVITGASSGIGLELARNLGEKGYSLLLVAEEESLFEKVNELRNEGIITQALKSDLATYPGVEEVIKAVKNHPCPLEILVINAGVVEGGAFQQVSLKKEMKLISLNVTSAVHLTKGLLPVMYQRQRGHVLFTTSTNAFFPSPYNAVYAASKVFLSTFATALRKEAEDYGVNVTQLMPGPTRTNIFHRGGMENTIVGGILKYQDNPAQVAKDGIKAMFKKRASIYSHSLTVKLVVSLSHLLPDSIKSRIMGVLNKPRPWLKKPVHG